MTAPPPDVAEDVADLIDQLVTGFNAKRPDATSAIFTEDGSVVTPPGQVVRGRDELREDQAMRLGGPAADWEISAEVEHLDAVTDDVVLAQVRQDMTTPGGPFSNIGTVVAVRDGDAWRVVRYHNTRITT